jgi:plastocyanin
MNGVLTVEPGADDARTARLQAVDEGFTGDKLRFDPAKLSVTAGTTLLVANVGGKPHTLTADDGSFDTGIVEPGAEGGRFAGKNASVTLNQAGTFKFHCEIHPAAMKGVGRSPARPRRAARPRRRPAREVDAADFGFEPNVRLGGRRGKSGHQQGGHPTPSHLTTSPDSGTIDPGVSADPVSPRRARQPATAAPSPGQDAACWWRWAATPRPERQRPPRRSRQPPRAAAEAALRRGHRGASRPRRVARSSGIGLSAFALRRRAAT